MEAFLAAIGLLAAILLAFGLLRRQRHYPTAKPKAVVAPELGRQAAAEGDDGNGSPNSTALQGAPDSRMPNGLTPAGELAIGADTAPSQPAAIVEDPRTEAMLSCCDGSDDAAAAATATDRDTSTDPAGSGSGLPVQLPACDRQPAREDAVLPSADAAAGAPPDPPPVIATEPAALANAADAPKDDALSGSPCSVGAEADDPEGARAPAERTNAQEEAGTDICCDLEAEPAFPPAPHPAPEGLRKVRAKPQRRPAVHRDRRGGRRAPSPAPAPTAEPAPPRAVHGRLPAEARLRLLLDPIRRMATLSVVLTRPDGLPRRITVEAAERYDVEAYDDQRYDDLDLPWTADLLASELRLVSAEGFQWLRSARQVHIFAEDPAEPGLVSVSAARLGVANTIVCRTPDIEAIQSAARLAGSASLQPCVQWQGIPDGWMVLSGYTPLREIGSELPAGLRALDPGTGLEIHFEGGLALRARVYAAGHPPLVVVSPAPGSASVTIGGEPATLSESGGWVAPGWDAPGQHIVDVVPGPSASYEIAADPWTVDGWDHWDAHPDRFPHAGGKPWAHAQICGAKICGQTGEAAVAAESHPLLVVLGAGKHAVPLQRRGDAPASFGFLPEPPAFLLSAAGRRRLQGRVVYLGVAPAPQPSGRPDTKWISAVRIAASRRLPLEGSDAVGDDLWQKAKERARRLRKPPA